MQDKNLQINPISKRLNPFIATLLTLLSLTVSTISNGANLTSSVDRNKININETLTLRVEYDAQTSADQLDFAPIQNEFEVLGYRPSSSNNLSIINGQTTRDVKTTWTLTLAPRREGTLVIPSFNLAGDVSNAIRIEVTKESTASAQNQPILVTLTADVTTAYPGQQILVKVELKAQESISNLSGEQLKLDDATVELLDQQSFRRVANGISWQVVEWSYAVFPEKAGTLAIPAQLFSGVQTTSTQRNAYDPFRSRQGQRIAARSPATAITIKDMPATNGTPWFPANDVVVTSDWSGDTSQMRVGEPITRIIEIAAVGQRSSVIPPLEESSSLLYKSYKDQPQLDNSLTADGVLGIRRESEAIVPSAEGLLQLQEQRIAWWDPSTNSWQEAVLPAETFNVLPALQGTNFAPPSGVPQFLPDGAEPEAITLIDPMSIWWKIAVAFLALICAVQFWILQKRSAIAALSTLDKTENAKITETESAAWERVQKALKSKDLREIRKTLLTWSRVRFADVPNPSLKSLSNTVNHSDSDNLSTLLSTLDKSIYQDSAQSPPLDIAALNKALSELRQNSEQKIEKPSGLASLYPA